MMNEGLIPKLISGIAGLGFAAWPLYLSGNADRNNHDMFPHLGTWLILALVVAGIVTLIWPQYRKSLLFCMSLPVLPALIYGFLKSSDSDVGWLLVVGFAAVFWGIYLFTCAVGAEISSRIHRLRE